MSTLRPTALELWNSTIGIQRVIDTLSSTMSATSTTPLPVLTTQSVTSYWIVREIMEKTWGLATIFDFSFIIVSIVNMTKPNNFFRSPYFILLTICMTIRGSSYLIRFYKFNSPTCPTWYTTTYEIWNGFSMLWHGIIILALAANRTTALGFPMKHNSIWSLRNFALLGVFIFFWPFIPNLFIAHIFYCYWMVDKDGGYCRSTFIGTQVYIRFSNLITPSVALLLNVITIVTKRSKTTILSQTSSSKLKIETQLLYQSFYSTVFFTLWAFLTIMTYQMTPIIRATTDKEFSDFLLLVRNWLNQAMALCGLFYFEGGLILLMWMSRATRQAYFNFYYIDKCWNKIYGSTVIKSTIVTVTQ